MLRRPHAAFVVLIGLLLMGCRDKEPAGERASSDVAPPVESGPPAVSVKSTEPKSVAPPAPAACPPFMKRVQGGSFWVGTAEEVFEREENPRFKTTVRSFCADTHEVSVEEYEACVLSGKCTPAHDPNNKTCNTSQKGKGSHPINCIDYHQAVAVCQARSVRLPTEVEWEYMARGGEEMRKYPWGSEPPDGRTCWNHAGTCERGSFAEGAFGLHDVVGNVWEWTGSWFGSYPWPAVEGRHKVYRGGSWSRRFEKWLRPSLRNRLNPNQHGSHLGVRCVASLPDESCPYGGAEGGECRFGVDEVSCLDRGVWNGLRCAKKGDPSRCSEGATEVAGHGCVREATPAAAAPTELDLSSVSRTRSPQFDDDCRTNSPEKPTAYQLTGGGHLERNAVGKQHGCKNRDVGVGFNSACCP